MSTVIPRKSVGEAMNSPNWQNHQKEHNPKGERENPYSNAVLVGNWFEERFAHKCDCKAISPAVYGVSHCMKDISTQRSDFKAHIIKRNKEDYSDFTKWKQEGFHNRLMNENGNIYLSNGDQFTENYTTLKDLMFRIIPERDIFYNVLVPKKEKIDFDFMKSFGNQTKTGLLAWLKCERSKDENTPIDMSHYQTDFKPYKINSTMCRYNGDQRKTQIWFD